MQFHISEYGSYDLWARAPLRMVNALSVERPVIFDAQNVQMKMRRQLLPMQITGMREGTLKLYTLRLLPGYYTLVTIPEPFSVLGGLFGAVGGNRHFPPAPVTYEVKRAYPSIFLMFTIFSIFFVIAAIILGILIITNVILI